MTYFYTYKITCLCGSLKDHYYLGQHRTDNLDDGYAGSGHILLKYYKKYGQIEGSSYTKEILAFYNDKEELNEAECLLIGDKHKTDPLCLNLQGGGYYNEWCDDSKKKASDSAKKRPKRGVSPLLGKPRTEKFKEKLKQNWKDNGHPFQGKHHSDETKQKIHDKALGRPSPWKGKHFNEEQRREISEKAKQRPPKQWIHNDEIEKYVPVAEVDYYVSNGWSIGRSRKMRDHLRKISNNALWVTSARNFL